MRFFRYFLIATTMLASSGAPVRSAELIENLMRRESLVPPVVSWLQMQGNKLTYIGDNGGLKGYLAEAANGKMQVLYVTPDGNHIVAGLLIEKGGKNVTGIQLGEMRRRFQEAGEAVDKLGSESPVMEGSEDSAAKNADNKVESSSSADVNAGATADADADVEIDDAAAPVPQPDEIEALPATKAENQLPVGDDGIPPVQTNALRLPEATGPAEGAAGNPSEPFRSTIDRDAFLKAAEETAYFEVGSKSAPVTVWMVADPKCPYCHAAWDTLRPLVMEKKIKTRIILIEALKGSLIPAKQILSSPQPARLWLDSRAGRELPNEFDQSSKQWADTEVFLQKNRAFADQFGVNRTPFLGYVAEDGAFYSVLGLPSEMDAFLAAITNKAN